MDFAERIANYVVVNDRDIIVEIVQGTERTRALTGGCCRIRVHGIVSDMAAIMATADMCVGAAGGTSWERCCLGLPTVVVSLADNQRENGAALTAAGAIDYVEIEGQSDEAAAVANAVATLLQDDDRRAAMSKSALAICDGAGVGRVLTAITELRNG